MLLSQQDMIAALERLGQLAAADGYTLHLVVVGGAAMVLGYNARLSTHDIDALFLPPPEARVVRHWANVVAQEYGWPEDWLNDAAKGYLIGLSSGPILLNAPGIEVRQPSVEQLLAMKLCAWRDDVDIADAGRLLGELASFRQRKAAILELLAQRTEQTAPMWTQEVGAVPEPFYLLEAAARMKRLRALCETEAPEPLRKRGLYAPPDFLSFV